MSKSVKLTRLNGVNDAFLFEVVCIYNSGELCSFFLPN